MKNLNFYGVIEDVKLPIKMLEYDYSHPIYKAFEEILDKEEEYKDLSTEDLNKLSNTISTSLYKIEHTLIRYAKHSEELCEDITRLNEEKFSLNQALNIIQVLQELVDEAKCGLNDFVKIIYNITSE
jgi:CHASE3 domain sensor protein